MKRALLLALLLLPCHCKKLAENITDRRNLDPAQNFGNLNGPEKWAKLERWMLERRKFFRAPGEVWEFMPGGKLNNGPATWRIFPKDGGFCSDLTSNMSEPGSHLVEKCYHSFGIKCSCYKESLACTLILHTERIYTEPTDESDSGNAPSPPAAKYLRLQTLDQRACTE